MSSNDNVSLKDTIKNGEDISKIVFQIFGSDAPIQKKLDTRVKRIFDKVKKPHQQQSLDAAKQNLDSLGISAQTKTEIYEILTDTIRKNIGVIVDDVFAKEPSALITDTDYNGRHYLGVRVHFQSVSPEAAKQIKGAFIDNLCDAAGWKHTDYDPRTSFGMDA